MSAGCTAGPIINKQARAMDCRIMHAAVSLAHANQSLLRDCRNCVLIRCNPGFVQAALYQVPDVYLLVTVGESE